MAYKQQEKNRHIESLHTLKRGSNTAKRRLKAGSFKKRLYPQFSQAIKRGKLEAG